MLIVTIANLCWSWCIGIEHVTQEKMTAPMAFLLHVMLPLIGMAILQARITSKISKSPKF